MLCYSCMLMLISKLEILLIIFAILKCVKIQLEAEIQAFKVLVIFEAE